MEQINRPASELLAEMGMDVETVLKSVVGKDKRVCRCGHAMTRHDSEGVCGTGTRRMMTCHCQGDNLKAVFSTDDLECFRFADAGSGTEHALAKGIARLASKGKGGFWLPNTYVCTVNDCGIQEKLMPVVLDMYHSSGAPKVVNILNKKMNSGPYPGWKDHFLCPSHFEQLSENYGH